MIIVHLAGGLGNQMFQYAFGRANAERLGAELTLELSNKTLKIHNGFELDRIFKIQAREATSFDMKAVLGLQRYKVVRRSIKRLGLGKVFFAHYVEERDFHFSQQMLNLPDNTYVCGYWLSEKYFSEIAAQIRRDFSFRLQLENRNAELAKQINQVNAVSLHVRRGDYANKPKVAATQGMCSLDYYQKAIEYVAARVERPCFFVFSDDITWVRNNLKIDYPHQYVEHNHGAESYNDMRLMSLCKHNIIANSTFSWWGAWLNHHTDKIVISPQEWLADRSVVSDYKQFMEDLIPSGWVAL